MTSGGTESLLLAIKTYRDRARVLTPHITKPEAIMCHSVHVAVPKGEHSGQEQQVWQSDSPALFAAGVFIVWPQCCVCVCFLSPF